MTPLYTEIPLITKFNTNNVLYDRIGDIGNSYISLYQDADYIYFLKNTNGDVLKYNTISEEYETVKLESNGIYSLMMYNGDLYGFEGYKTKRFVDDTVLYIKDNNKLVQESFDKQIKVTHLSSSSQISDFILDEDMNYTVVHNGNKISKFTKDRVLLYSYTLLPNELVFTGYQILTDNPIQILSIDYVREYTDVGIKKYPIVLASVKNETSVLSANSMFLCKFDETNQNIYDLQFLGLTGAYYPFGHADKVNYNLTNYEYLKNNYTENDEIRFKVVLQNVYNNKDIIKVNIPISTKYFSSESHHFALKVDGIEGRISVYLDGKEVQTVNIQKGQYIFQELFDESFTVGNTYFHNNVTLSEYLNQKNYYYINNAKIKQFKIYKKALTDNEIDFHVYRGIKMDDLVVSLPCDQRNELDGIERQFKLDTTGNKSNSINIIVKNSNITNETVKNKMKLILIDKLSKVLPVTTKINNIEFR